MSPKLKILVIEDDKATARLVTEQLSVISEQPCAVRSRGCRCDVFALSSAAAEGSPTWLASLIATEAYLRAARAESVGAQIGSRMSAGERGIGQAGAVVRVALLRALSAPAVEIEWAVQMAEPATDGSIVSTRIWLGMD